MLHLSLKAKQVDMPIRAWYTVYAWLNWKPILKAYTHGSMGTDVWFGLKTIWNCQVPGLDNFFSIYYQEPPRLDISYPTQRFQDSPYLDNSHSIPSRPSMKFCLAQQILCWQYGNVLPNAVCSIYPQSKEHEGMTPKTWYTVHGWLTWKPFQTLHCQSKLQNLLLKPLLHALYLSHWLKKKKLIFILYLNIICAMGRCFNTV